MSLAALLAGNICCLTDSLMAHICNPCANLSFLLGPPDTPTSAVSRSELAQLVVQPAEAMSEFAGMTPKSRPASKRRAWVLHGGWKLLSKLSRKQRGKGNQAALRKLAQIVFLHERPASRSHLPAKVSACNIQQWFVTDQIVTACTQCKLSVLLFTAEESARFYANSPAGAN